MFGRSTNMVRRANRPDGSFYRGKRRGKLDQATLLDILNAPPAAKRRNVIARIVGAIVGGKRH
jgi:hypothetical protein